MSRLKRTVLCIDDHWTGLIARKQCLEQNGYRVLESVAGDEGLKLFSRNSVDAVVLDYQLPGVTGDVIAAKMKRLKPHVPILLLSPYGPLPDPKLESVDAFLTTSQEEKFLLSVLQHLFTIRSRPFLHRWFDLWSVRNRSLKP